MSWIDKVKGVIMGPDDEEDYGDYQDEVYEENERDFDFLSNSSSKDFEEPRPEFSSSYRQSKVVDFNSAPSSQSAKPHVVVAKLEKFEDVGEVTKSINDKRIVIINLETASNDITQRIIDFIYGVTIANKAELKRVAYRTYMVKPYGYDYVGGIDDEYESGGFDGMFFGKD